MRRASGATRRRASTAISLDLIAAESEGCATSRVSRGQSCLHLPRPERGRAAPPAPTGSPKPRVGWASGRAGSAHSHAAYLRRRASRLALIATVPLRPPSACSIIAPTMASATTWPALLRCRLPISTAQVTGSQRTCARSAAARRRVDTPRRAMGSLLGDGVRGNSAIAAVAPVIGADSDDVAASIAFTAVLGVVVVLGLPLLGLGLGMSGIAFGALAGLTVYAVPQVIAAASPLGAVAVQTGTLVKLVRVLMLGPVCLVLSRGSRRGLHRRQPPTAKWSPARRQPGGRASLDLGAMVHHRLHHPLSRSPSSWPWCPIPRRYRAGRSDCDVADGDIHGRARPRGGCARCGQGRGTRDGCGRPLSSWTSRDQHGPPCGTPPGVTGPTGPGRLSPFSKAATRSPQPRRPFGHRVAPPRRLRGLRATRGKHVFEATATPDRGQ